MERAKLAVSEYEKGRYISELKKMEKDLTVAQSNLNSSATLLVPSIAFVVVGVALLTRELRNHPVTLPLPPPRPPHDDD